MRIAIKEEQADIQSSDSKEEETLREGQNKNKAELGIKMLRELERHIEGKKRDKGNKSIAEIRRGMLHSQLIGEQMKGAQELRADTAQKMKTIELTEEERQEREKARYEIWETKIRKQRKTKETMEEMGWGNQKLRRRVEKKSERKEQITEKQQRKTHTKKKQRENTNRRQKRNKEREGRETKEKHTRPKKKRGGGGDKKKNRESSGSMASILRRRGGRDRRRGKEGERSTEQDKKNTEVVGRATIETYIKKGLEAEKGKEDEETYTLGDYTILDVNWGQYTEKRPGEIFKGRKAGKPLKEMMGESKKYIMVIHYSFHWSFVVIDNIKK